MLEATHLVAGGSGVPLKRTPKLLAGLGHCRFVVDVEWLYQSAKEGKLLDGVEFVLCDAEVCMSAPVLRNPLFGCFESHDAILCWVSVSYSASGTVGCLPVLRTTFFEIVLIVWR